MANAIWVVHRQHGLWNTDGGYEFPLVLIATAATLAFTARADSAWTTCSAGT